MICIPRKNSFGCREYPTPLTRTTSRPPLSRPAGSAATSPSKEQASHSSPPTPPLRKNQPIPTAHSPKINPYVIPLAGGPCARHASPTGVRSKTRPTGEHKTFPRGRSPTKILPPHRPNCHVHALHLRHSTGGRHVLSTLWFYRHRRRQLSGRDPDLAFVRLTSG